MANVTNIHCGSEAGKLAGQVSNVPCCRFPRGRPSSALNRPCGHAFSRLEALRSSRLEIGATILAHPSHSFSSSYVQETTLPRAASLAKNTVDSPFYGSFRQLAVAWLEPDGAWPSPESHLVRIEAKMDCMKHSKSIKHLLKIGAFLLASGWAQNVSAFNYTNSDVLLVFRKDNFNDVEFDLGSVSNFLGKVNGTVIPVTNWSLQTVTNNFNHSLLNVKFLLAAVTASDDPLRRAWLTDASSSDTPTDQSGSRLTQIYSKISEVGGEATAATFTNSSQVYITNASAVTSYSYIASGGGQLDASTLGGAAPFPIEIENPAANRFIELKASNVSPKPAATIVGTFSLTSAGVLTFTAGPPVTALTQSHIQSIARSGSLNTVTFSTTSGANYRLRYTTNLVSGASIWTILPTSIAGDGSNKTLTDTTSDPRRFYVVEAYH